MLVDVLIGKYLPKTYTYFNRINAPIGSIVSVELAGKVCQGIIFRKAENKENINYKDVLSCSRYVLQWSNIEWCIRTAEYNLQNLGLTVSNLLINRNYYQATIPPYFLFNGLSHSISTLAGELGKRALLKLVQEGELIPETYNQLEKPIKEQVYSSKVIANSTVYTLDNSLLEEAKEVLSLGGQVLILVPDIYLLEIYYQQLCQYFGPKVHFLHSKVNILARDSLWDWAFGGAGGIIIGTRAALWLPYSNLRLVIVLEEQSNAYVVNAKLAYHVRDMAVLRAKYEKASCILASTTPSLESLFNVEKGKYLFENKQPKLKYEDFRIVQKKTKEIITSTLKENIINKLLQKNKVLLLLPRKGFATKLLCEGCVKYLQCRQCSTGVAYYKNNLIKCIYCGLIEELSVCRICHKKSWGLHGVGIEKVEEELCTLFSSHKILLLSKDPRYITDEIKYKEIEDADIIVSSNLIPIKQDGLKLGLIAFIELDQFIKSTDPRSIENMNQLLTYSCYLSNQHKCEVIIQVNNDPSSYNITDEYLEWAKVEIRTRAKLELPPHYRLVRIVISSFNKVKSAEHARLIYEELKKYSLDYKVYPPATTPLEKYKLQYRYFVLISYPSNLYLQPKLSTIIAEISKKIKSKLTIDVGGYSFF